MPTADLQFPSLADLEAAHRRILPMLLPTPLLAARSVEAALWLKPENLQRTGSFKFRGAYHKLTRLTPKARARGVVAYSSGNHGQAVACAAQLYGCPATIVMPQDAVREKVEGVLRYGARIIACEGGSDERRRIAEELAATDGLEIVPPYDDLEIVMGQASVGLEIARERREVRQILVPVGGGGLLSGVGLAARALLPGVRIIGVEPAGADDLYRSIQSGEHVRLARVDTLADGLRTQSVGDLNYAILREVVDEVVTVSEEEILEAVRTLLLAEKLLVEPSGAVAFAAFQAGKVPRDVETAAVLSGGNISQDVLHSIIKR
ncbi:MAG: threonine/serine dehydratase [Thermaerobacter sp.]|nr:threonine/serine dehydratase [Thermaerobacter sp.]